MWGVVVGLGTLSSIFAVIVAAIVIIAVLWIVLTTPLGWFVLVGLILVGLYRLMR